jgi:hypothetical protein
LVALVLVALVCLPVASSDAMLLQPERQAKAVDGGLNHDLHVIDNQWTVA